ncbi:MAG: PAS domain-containing sensor histidine kinase [Chitinophagaceae bacterium]|nr:PAS domain-containing sensor histidine kinase [Chitinophagaceae bacterium]
MTAIFVLYVKKLYRSIEAEQMQVNALFEHATEGIILTDDKGKIILLNPAASTLFEYEKDELLGKSIEMLIPGRFHAKHTQYREGFYQHPSNRTMGHGRDLFARKKDGREFPVEVSLSYYRQKNSFFVIAFLVDITQRKQVEKELLDRKTELERITQDISRLNAELESKVEQRTLILREALQELEHSQAELSEALNKEKELNEIKSRFVSMASHEFRTPLSTVLSSAALLSRYTQSEDQDKRDKHIKRIKDSVKHLNDLLGDFLSLGKLEEGRIQAEMAPFQVKEFLDEVVEEMRPLAKPGQEIHCDCPGAETFISDKRLLKNILINLLSNASKFSSEGAGIWLQVRHSAGEGLILSVRDEGIGISVEDQQHLFSTFFRGANAMNIEGTGLGLHIVKRYAELLGGSLHLESQLNKGTTITVDVPEGVVA